MNWTHEANEKLNCNDQKTDRLSFTLNLWILLVSVDLLAVVR